MVAGKFKGEIFVETLTESDCLEMFVWSMGCILSDSVFIEKQVIVDDEVSLSLVKCD